MSRSERLKPVVKIVESRERDAARVLGHYQQALNQRRGKLAELESFRNEYSDRFQSAGAQGLGASQVRGFHTFLSNLTAAIQHEQQQVARALQEYEMSKQQWMTTHTKTRALDKVVDRYKKEENRVEQQREQGESDERALRMKSNLRENSSD